MIPPELFFMPIVLPVAVCATAVLAALAVDRWLGEPPVRWHPVVWMGSMLVAMARWVAPRVGGPVPGRAWPFLRGAVAWCGGALAVLALAVALQWLVLRLPWYVGVPLLGLLLKPLLAWRMLRDEVLAVDTALSGSLDAGRGRLARLVSRDVATLDAAQVREGAIETLAENLNDSVVAPLFWFVLAGLPGAALYRWSNTADAMWGYRGERQGHDWAWAGKWAARADDALSWLPARLTGLALLVGAPAVSWAGWGREARRTPSPNGGWPMAAMALALGVCLSKPAVYALHATARSPGAQDIGRAVRRAGRVVAGVAVLALAALWLVWLP